MNIVMLSCLSCLTAYRIFILFRWLGRYGSPDPMTDILLYCGWLIFVILAFV